MKGLVKASLIHLIIVIGILVALNFLTIFISYLSKLINLEISFYTFQPSQNYFNVTYFMHIEALVREVTVVIFNGSTPVSYVSLFNASSLGYPQISYFNLSGTVYLPNNQILTIFKNVKAFNITTNNNYILFAKIRPNNTIVIWLLYYFLGK